MRRKGRHYPLAPARFLALALGTRVLVDTGAFYALVDQHDGHHADARAFYYSHVTRITLITTNYILIETCLLLDSRLTHQTAMDWWRSIVKQEVPVAIVEVQPDDLVRALKIVDGFPDQDFSMVDCTTLALMERVGLQHAFTFDHHFLIYRYGSPRAQAFLKVP